jgi:nicotinamidase-related amidase
VTSSSTTALVVIDMLNRYEHPDADRLKPSVARTVPVMASLIADAEEAEVLTVWVNDNHGDWTAGRSRLTSWALDGAEPSLVEPVKPRRDAPFLVKARHSAFYATQLDYLLREQGVEHLVLIGQVTEQCVLYSALDAYIRHFDITVPRDAVAHIDKDLGDAALRMMEVNMSARIVDAREALDVHAASRR